MPRSLLLVLLSVSLLTAKAAGAVEFSLYAAAKSGDVAEVRRLLAEDAEPNLRERFDAPLHAAAATGSVDVARLLIEAGADVDQEGFLGAPLHVAASTGSLGAAELLLSYGAKVDALNSYGSTPLQLAAEHGDLSVVRVLLAAGADIEAGASRSSPTPILSAAMQNHSDVVRLLAKAGANLEILDVTCRGFTVLHHAVLFGDRSLVRDLLQAGADPASRSPDGETPLSRAVKSGDAALAELLRPYTAPR